MADKYTASILIVLILCITFLFGCLMFYFEKQGVLYRQEALIEVQIRNTREITLQKCISGAFDQPICKAFGVKLKTKVEVE